MTEYFLEGKYEMLELHHVRMGFSGEIEQVGRAGVGKAVHLLGLIVRTLFAKFRTGAQVLYYPPAGPNMVPFLRDCVFLIAVRPFFPRTVFHFHAAGLPTLYQRLSAPLRFLFRFAYHNPDCAITISQDGMRDAKALQARKIAFVPNGVPDCAFPKSHKSRPDAPTIVFLSMICEEKGVGVLLDACHLLQAKGISFRCRIAGRASSDREFQKLKLRATGLGKIVEFVGPVSGAAKWTFLSKGDIFCFPTYYTSESFGLVVLEAMMFSLPVVATTWRALPEIVVEGKTGFLTPTRDPAATAQRLETLLINPMLRARMGQAGRHRYEEHYRVDVFQKGMENALLEVGP